ncbi:MAG TPA: hypothetical protein VN808_00255 [Stellaceae bacterium]|nr:hypothetical protein [Stellaceae bacterium]
MTTRITQRTRTNSSQSSFAASSASTFSISTNDPSLSVMTAPMPALMLAFGGKSGFQALPTRPLWPQRPPPVPPSAENAAPEPVPESSVAELSAESSPTDRSASDAATEKVEPDAASDTYVPRSRGARHLRLLEHPEAPPADQEQEAVPPPELDAVKSGEPEPAEPEPALPATEPEPAEPAHPHRLEMTIDSLPHHDLTEPIPIHIDPLGDTVFTASVSNLDISATGNSIGEALVLLKEQIEFVYGDLSRRAKRSPDQTAMLQMLHTYIAPNGTKPSWL